jgi:hypothetical protein
MGMQNNVKPSLIEHFQDPPATSAQRIQDHDLIDILVIRVRTLLCGGEFFNDMEDVGHAKDDWFRFFVTWSQRHSYSRHLKLRARHSGPRGVSRLFPARDGKALRRAFKADKSDKYVVSVWPEDNRPVLGQFRVADKSNETIALPELLRVLELSSSIVTVDGIGSQKKNHPRSSCDPGDAGESRLLGRNRKGIN